MGNRAVIQFGDAPDAIGIYVHWNGGPESVLAFLDVGKQLKIRADDSYGPARLCQIISNFFGGVDSVGIGPAASLDRDNYDNGTYIVDNKLAVVARQHTGSLTEGVTKVEHLSPADRERYAAIKEEVLRVNAPFFKKDYQHEVRVTLAPRKKD